jgi:uncharacterized protein (DUF1499 family)
MRASLIACGIAGLGLVLLALAGPSYRIGLPLGFGFGLLRYAAYVGLAAAVVSIGIGAWQWKRSRAAAAVAAVAAVVGLGVAWIPFSLQRRAQSVPPIHDISTDLENPPAFAALVPLRADAPNPLNRTPDVNTQQRQGYPDLAPLTLPEPSGQVFARAQQTAQRLGWEIVKADPATGLIEATDTTRWFGFVDDVVVRITPWGTGTRVDLRSVSRVGRSDIGTNAERIRNFLAALQAP